MYMYIYPFYKMSEVFPYTVQFEELFCKITVLDSSFLINDWSLAAFFNLFKKTEVLRYCFPWLNFCSLVDVPLLFNASSYSTSILFLYWNA